MNTKRIYLIRGQSKKLHLKIFCDNCVSVLRPVILLYGMYTSTCICVSVTNFTYIYCKIFRSWANNFAYFSVFYTVFKGLRENFKPVSSNPKSALHIAFGEQCFGSQLHFWLTWDATCQKIRLNICKKLKVFYRQKYINLSFEPIKF
jgi:hypothetical protein